VHLCDLYWRPDDSTRQYWTEAYVPGKRFIGKDVYILTSKETLSAAEGFTYAMKALKRATIIGETTAGLSHPGSSVRINANFGMVVPQGRTINALTKSDWEGTGVRPDIEVTAAQALPTAHLIALRKALEKETDAERKEGLKQAIRATEKEVDSPKGKK
jgi:C-terminal processing protease CtpA/Prc